MNYLHALLLLPIAAAEGYNYSHLEDNLLKFSEHAYVLVKGWKVGSPMGKRSVGLPYVGFRDVRVDVDRLFAVHSPRGARGAALLLGQGTFALCS